LFAILLKLISTLKLRSSDLNLPLGLPFATATPLKPSTPKPSCPKGLYVTWVSKNAGLWMCCKNSDCRGVKDCKQGQAPFPYGPRRKIVCCQCPSGQVLNKDNNGCLSTGVPSPSTTAKPTSSPACERTPSPSAVPEPTPYGPTLPPTYQPTPPPTYQPTPPPTYSPTLSEPTPPPVYQPTPLPTYRPTPPSTDGPTYDPTYEETRAPTNAIIISPSLSDYPWGPLFTAPPTRKPTTSKPVKPNDETLCGKRRNVAVEGYTLKNSAALFKVEEQLFKPLRPDFYMCCKLGRTCPEDDQRLFQRLSANKYDQNCCFCVDPYVWVAVEIPYCT
jgi:hypothetical protein